MGKRRYRKTRRDSKKQRKLIILSMVSLLFIMCVGYAAFSTNLNITARGNILDNSITISDLKAKNCNATSGDGLYNDIYEEGRCFYKGENPNNYIEFDTEDRTDGEEKELWRIISIEKKGSEDVLKIMKNDSIGQMPFDSEGYRDSDSTVGGTYCTIDSGWGCNFWATTNFLHSENDYNGSREGTVLKDAEINTYLNTNYFTGLNSSSQKYIEEEGTYNIGPVGV